MSTCKSKEIFIPEPYNIIIVMGGDDFHKLDQLNVIQKTTEANLSHKAKFLQDEYGNEFDVTIFHWQKNALVTLKPMKNKKN